MPLNAEQFREAAAKRRKTKDVEIEGVGAVRLRALSAAALQKFQHDAGEYKREGKNVEELAFPLIAKSLIGENGDLFYPDEEVGIAEARALDPVTFSVLTDEVLSLNGLTVSAVDDAAKNSEASREGSTPTDSPTNSDTSTSI